MVTSLVLAHTHDGGLGLFDTTAESIDRHMAMNVRSFLLLMQAFAERVRDSGTSGRIVLFSSGPPQKGSIAYGASKGAIEWMTYSAATELGPLGITVNAVNPGPNQSGWMSPEVERAAAQRTPLGRAGQPGDAAALVSFLLSADAAFINGQLITSDGGHARRRLLAAMIDAMRLRCEIFPADLDRRSSSTSMFCVHAAARRAPTRCPPTFNAARGRRRRCAGAAR